MRQQIPQRLVPLRSDKLYGLGGECSVPRCRLGENPGFGYHAVVFMIRAVTIVLFLGLTVSFGFASDKAVLGSWEGDSKCTVPDSPCHDEHLLYQIAQDKKDPFQLNLDAYKIVEGAPDFVGTLTCHFESKTGG